jgi:putative addiction module killer protein
MQKASDPESKSTVSHLGGYRIYFGRDGDRLVILLGGGTKKRQQDDIRDAQAYWADYRRRKRKEQ